MLSFRMFLTEARSGLPHITNLKPHEVLNLASDGYIRAHNITEKTDGQSFTFGHDEHGFFTQHTGTNERMRGPEHYMQHAQQRAEKTGKPLEQYTTSATAFGHIHNILANNQAFQDHLRNQFNKTGKEVVVKGEMFYKPWSKEGDKPGERRFVGTSYDTSHMGNTGKIVIHSQLSENQGHDLEHFKKHLSNNEINFDDDKIQHRKMNIDVRDEINGIRNLNHELLSARTTKANKEAKEAEKTKYDSHLQSISKKVDDAFGKSGISPKWGSGSEGFVIHPPESHPEAPRVKVTSSSFREFKAQQKLDPNYKEKLFTKTNNENV